MKRSLFICCIGLHAMTSAQVITLNDSVIFSDAKPAAFYISQPNSFSTLPNTDIFTLDGSYAIEAVLFEFAAPVRELKAFHYYQLRFPATLDTVSILYDGNDFTRHLAEQAIKYQLLPGKDEKANKAAIRQFREQYNGIVMLEKKMEEINSFLNYTRAFNFQVVRDRTKPVTLVNNRKIMQDDVMIGTFNLAKDLTQTNAALSSPSQRLRPSGAGTFSTISTTDYETRIKNEAEIFFLNGIQVKTLSLSDHYTNINNKKEIGYGLFALSRKKNYEVGEGDDFLIRFLCFLIEDLRL